MKEKKQESAKSFVFEIIKMFLLALVIILPIRIFLFQPFIVRGASMEPNFHGSEYVIVNEIGYKNIELLNGKFKVEPRKEFNRQEIVVFRAPTKKKEFYIKRIIGLPGETVEVNNGVVKIYNIENPSGKILDESSYLPKGRITTGNMKISLKENEYFVLGDNRNASSDSRSFGPINKSAVVGRVLLRVFPFSKAQVF